MSHLTRASSAIYSPEDREKIADAVLRIEAILHDLDAIGPMLGSAHLSLAIETLRKTANIEIPN